MSRVHGESMRQEGQGAAGAMEVRHPGQDGWASQNSIPWRVVTRMLDRVAPTDATVLILGESGVGKALVARALHEQSQRRHGPFVKVNCAALPLELLESELFGYERGAFTGAYRQYPGRFELANTGTIVLDEIGEMPLPLQAKLLQVLQDREFSRLGGRHDIRVDVRIVAATNKNLAALVEQGQFRDDLYYRLNVMSIYVPPLRERLEEVPVLIEHFLAEHARQYGRPRPSVSASTLERMMDHSWPGNVRELENFVKRVILLESEALALERFDAPLAAPPAESTTATAIPGADGGPGPGGPGIGLREIARRAASSAEAATLREVLGRVHWNRLEASKLLRISYKTLLYKMKQHGLG
jgi:two-component system response regulator AtoC